MTSYEPQFRYKLKSRVIGKGFKSIGEFACATGINETKMSRIIRGWEIPSATLQRKIARALGISMKDLRKLI